jgi:hypothetical protein
MTKMLPANSEIGAVAAAIVTCGMLIAVPAWAVDGEILIDQAAVNAGSITPGDTAGFPATLSRPGRYKLNGNLVVPTFQIGIYVTASDVTVDLDGYTIRSASPGTSGTGVFGQPASANRLRVMNGTITGFGDFGVSNRQSFGAEAAIIENLRVVENKGGIFIGPHAQIRDSTIANSQGGNLSCAHSCLIEGNVITGSAAGAGISITGGTILGNVIVGNKFGVVADVTTTGYGNNILVGNNSGGAQVTGPAVQLHPNACAPACP